ncbi:MAG: UDP-N-acetylmuramoyl-L-alanyl-D-glutamate--2,6-diaminopimelate ligase [bacterium]
MYSFDSRKITPGDTFLCLPGAERYIEHAMRNGAVDHVHLDRQTLAVFAKYYFSCPDEQLFIIGITGTNGKTTISHMVHQTLVSLGHNSLLLGTLHSPLTTMESWDLFSCFYDHLWKGGTHVVMEVSSHGIAQHRIFGIDFNIKCLSNISQDHLDFHHTFAAYKACKLSFMNASSCVKVFPLEVSRLSLPFKNPLLGHFNLNNVKAAYRILQHCDLPNDLICQSLKKTTGVCGRFEAIKNSLSLQIFIDFAHTPAALKALLTSGRLLAKKTCGRLWIVFGCGGNRDQNKRAKMGAIASSISDVIVLCNDNPRNEDPARIIQDICQGIQHSCFKVIPDRKKAIFHAVQHITPNDILLVAGKGHESQQITRGRSIPFSDKEVILSALTLLKKK